MPATSPRLSRTCLAVGVAAALCMSVACDKGPAPTGPSTPGVTPPMAPISTGPIAFASNRNGPIQIYLANADGSSVTRLTEGIHPAWSPDGRRIAFAGGPPSGGVYVINRDGTGLRRIATGVQPAWSPDGRRIAYMGGATITGGIFVVDVDGGGARLLVDHAFGLQGLPDLGDYSVEHPTWSPDGRSIAFGTHAGYSIFDTDSSVFIMNDDGTDRRHLVYGTYPAWSPGPLIAFHGSGGIEALGADGSGRRVVVPGRVRVSSWTPNGGLLFIRDSRVFVWEGGTERQLIPDAEGPAVPGYWDSDAVWSR